MPCLAFMDVQHPSDSERKKLPRFPVPCSRMGRLARRSAHAGTGLGEVLMGCAVDRCLHAHGLVGAYAPLTLYLPLD